MILQCSNHRRMIILNKDEVDLAFIDQITPCVALLSAWRPEQAGISYWKDIVCILLDHECTYFVCIGASSEQLHDAIDDFLYQYDDEHGVEKSIGVVTTYHANESIEDAVNFFVHSTVVSDKGYLVAILDAFDNEDQKVIRCLESS